MPVRLANAKPRNGRASAVKLLKSLKPYRFSLGLSVLCSIVAAVLGVLGPKILGEMTTSATNSIAATGKIDWTPIVQSVMVLLIVYSVSAVAAYFESYIASQAAAKYTRQLRAEILDKISRLPISYFDKHQFGDTLSRMNNDVDVLAGSLSQEVSEIIASLATVIGILAMMLIISVPLSIIALITVPVSLFFVGRMVKMAQKLFNAQRTTLGKLNSYIEEDYSGQTVIKANSHEKSSRETFAGANQTLYEQSWKSQFLSSLAFPFTHFFTNLGYAAICVLGGFFVVSGQLTIGSLQAFIQYVGRFNRPITNVSEITATLQMTLAAAERIFNFLDEPEELPDPVDAKTIKNIRGQVEFHQVNFSYDKEKPVIKDFSAKIEPGMQIAIVGPTGAGKTTLINLLMRFYDPDSGYISIDGVPTKEMRRADVRRLFGMVLQDTWLFSGTIEENLRYGNREATHADIVHAAKIANIDHYIESLNNGYNSRISEDSDNISAGEKQLLTIARAIVANPPMIILDEATSNVDTRTEQLIQNAFEKLTRGRTSFVIAHRLSTIRNADLILVIKNGNIVEQGTHETLLALNGFYAELYNSQFSET